MAHTVAGLFTDFAQAQKVQQTLIQQGVDSNDIDIHASSENASSYTGTEDYRDKATDYSVTDESVTDGSTRHTAAANHPGEGVGDKIKNFFSSLTGGDDELHHHYASGINQGGALLTVHAQDDAEAQQIASLLRQHGAREIEGGNASTNQAETAYGGASNTGTAQGESIPVIEEQVEVGKRQVDRGGVRVYSRVTEKPVDREITLTDERINVERRPANRAATAADFAAASRGSIELTATGEEAVVGKTARVVEEVFLGKQNTTRTEDVHESVRTSDVEVEQLAGRTRDTNLNRS